MISGAFLSKIMSVAQCWESSFSADRFVKTSQLHEERCSLVILHAAPSPSVRHLLRMSRNSLQADRRTGLPLPSFLPSFPTSGTFARVVFDAVIFRVRFDAMTHLRARLCRGVAVGRVPLRCRCVRRARASDASECAVVTRVFATSDSPAIRGILRVFHLSHLEI